MNIREHFKCLEKCASDTFVGASESEGSWERRTKHTWMSSGHFRNLSNASDSQCLAISRRRFHHLSACGASSPACTQLLVQMLSPRSRDGVRREEAGRRRPDVRPLDQHSLLFLSPCPAHSPREPAASPLLPHRTQVPLTPRPELWAPGLRLRNKWLHFPDHGFQRRKGHAGGGWGP